MIYCGNGTCHRLLDYVLSYVMNYTMIYHLTNYTLNVGENEIRECKALQLHFPNQGERNRKSDLLCQFAVFGVCNSEKRYRWGRITEIDRGGCG